MLAYFVLVVMHTSGVPKPPGIGELLLSLWWIVAGPKWMANRSAVSLQPWSSFEVEMPAHS